MKLKNIMLSRKSPLKKGRVEYDVINNMLCHSGFQQETTGMLGILKSRKGKCCSEGWQV